MKSKDNTIVQSRLIGGLGNQLFIYAFSRAMALRNQAQLQIDVTSGFLEDKKYKRRFELDRLDLEFVELKSVSRIKRKLLKFINYFLPFKMKHYHFEDAKYFNEEYLNQKINGKVFFEGYWQNYRYFEDENRVIQSELYKSLQKLIINHEVYELVCNNNCVAIHVRFFDIDDPTTSTVLIEEYYQVAITRITNSVHKPYFLIFSDNIERAEVLLSPILNNYKFKLINYPDLLLIEEFALMCSCNHFIISNSSFSWWGAWLGNLNNKQIYAPNISVPKSENGSWNVDDLIPKSWKLVDIKYNGQKL